MQHDIQTGAALSGSRQLPGDAGLIHGPLWVCLQCDTLNQLWGKHPMGVAAGCGVNIPWVRGTGMQGKVPVVPGAVCDGAKFPEDIVTATLCVLATSWPCM